MDIYVTARGYKTSGETSQLRESPESPQEQLQVDLYSSPRQNGKQQDNWSTRVTDRDRKLHLPRHQQKCAALRKLGEVISSTCEAPLC
ncbi:hypothetical protein PAMP_023614 [Pampus punctatissimus]